MFEKMKFILSGIGSFLWPLIKQFLVASAPLVKAAAIAAVNVTISKYAGTLATNSEKHQDAYGMIVGELQQKGLQIGKDFTESMIDTAIAAAVKQLK